jgi:hypothetical protein
MAQPSPLSVLSGALKIADKVTVATGNNYRTTLPPLCAVERFEDRGQVHRRDGSGRKQIRLNCQGWEGARIIRERQVLMVVAHKGQLYLLPEDKLATFEHIDDDRLHEAGTGRTTSNE